MSATYPIHAIIQGEQLNRFGASGNATARDDLTILCMDCIAYMEQIDITYV